MNSGIVYCTPVVEHHPRSWRWKLRCRALTAACALLLVCGLASPRLVAQQSAPASDRAVTSPGLEEELRAMREEIHALRQEVNSLRQELRSPNRP